MTDTGQTVPPRSLFQQVLDLWRESGPLSISFDDLTGVTLDFPQLLLPMEYGIHTCAACVYAKERPGGGRDCNLNKQAVSGLVVRGQEGLSGLCHLGLFELVEPLVVRSTMLGVFYYGSVAVVEREPESLRRIHRYCARRSFDPEPYLAAWRAVPRIYEADLPMYLARLKLLVETVRLWCEALAIPVERYPTLGKNVHWMHHRDAPFLVRSALKYVALRFGQPCRVADIAVSLNCNANYLSGEFKRHVGVNLADYLRSVRLERAKAMLEAGQLSIGEIGFRCGFMDTSHFIRVFKKTVGCTPKAFQAMPKS
jgi:AraC-like DNA-binding protein